MKYKYYGTAAAEGIPSLYCDCDVCKKAKKNGGKNIMTRSQSVIDDKILIDFSADTFLHYLNGLDLLKYTTYLITHSHEDHFYPMDLLNRRPGFARAEDVKPIDIYAGGSACDMTKELLDAHCQTGGDIQVTMHRVEPFVPFEAEGYKITPLAASHDPKSSPVFYLIEKGEKVVLHANDTGYFPESTWEYLRKNPVHIDFASFDCTMVDLYPENNENYGHMNYVTVLHTIDEMKKINMIDEKTVCYINHFSHNGKRCYDDLCKMTENDGIGVSYDGLEIEF